MDGASEIKKAYEAILDHDFEQAIASFERAIQLEPTNAAFHYKISITFARSNKLTKALQHAQLACTLNPDDKEYQFHLQHIQARALIFEAEKHFAQTDDQLHRAIALLKQAILLDPLAIEAFLLMGLAYAELHQYDEALKAIQEVLKLDPQHTIAEKLKADYERKLGT